jgi:hypothetical protein
MQKEIDDLRAQAVARRPRPTGLLQENEAKLSGLGVNLDGRQLLMEVREGKWSMDELLERAADFAPTLVLIKLKNGTECGGVAGVRSPNGGKMADLTQGSFIFWLGATPARFDLVEAGRAVYSGGQGFGFGGMGFDLCVWSKGGCCGSWGQQSYAGPRGKGQLVGGTAEEPTPPCERWELWRL